MHMRFAVASLATVSGMVVVVVLPVLISPMMVMIGLFVIVMSIATMLFMPSMSTLIPENPRFYRRTGIVLIPPIVLVSLLRIVLSRSITREEVCEGFRSFGILFVLIAAND
ncbi:Protein of unknown function [Pyronema omphalodes CBS 100304]|uniref:Uncharacterized protein n=1 Tax=Pyronema omphalodes (strain CBS 100304) TaxID=1076935 RepID=U4L9A8_PYROM|nr:Protein of unknown function [Pyronema omphalodes CBS 100304]